MTDSSMRHLSGKETPKVNVWLGFTKTKVYGSFMFAKPTVSGVTHLDMLKLSLQPQMIQDQVIHTVVYQQYGAPPHFANIVRDHLNRVFPNRWIGRSSPRIWAPRSPDLTPL